MWRNCSIINREILTKIMNSFGMLWSKDKGGLENDGT